MLRVFLSYHHSARKTAGRVKHCLSALGMQVFLAHEDLEPSTEWQQEILLWLRRCDIFIPLLTKSYHASSWTDQETGIAVSLKKQILPLKFSIDPYGFIGKFQALKARKVPEETCWKVVHALASRPAFRRALKNGAINTFVRSKSFDESGRIAANLLKLEPFSRAQLKCIVEGGAKNQQIYGGRAARDVVRKLIARNKSRLKRSLVRKFDKQVKSWPY